MALFPELASYAFEQKLNVESQRSKVEGALKFPSGDLLILVGIILFDTNSTLATFL